MNTTVFFFSPVDRSALAAAATGGAVGVAGCEEPRRERVCRGGRADRVQVGLAHQQGAEVGNLRLDLGRRVTIEEKERERERERENSRYKSERILPQFPPPIPPLLEASLAHPLASNISSSSRHLAAIFLRRSFSICRTCLAADGGWCGLDEDAAALAASANAAGSGRLSLLLLLLTPLASMARDQLAYSGKRILTLL